MSDTHLVLGGLGVVALVMVVVSLDRIRRSKY
jgi:hypothetical protein